VTALPNARLTDSRFVSRETWNRLARYETLVFKWQKSINLIAPSTVGSIRTRHILDSLQLFSLASKPRIWTDMGSGAGFPGLVTAICLLEAGTGWVHLVESNHKKAAFLRTAIAETGARATVHAMRIEDAAERLEGVEALSARALTALDDLLGYAALFARQSPDLECWFHKGLDYAEEVARARGHWSFDLIEHPSRVQDGSVILEIHRIAKL
jgi:Predicted S-adenosylmethionine-dependent methyltransferase involved in bacterial cell division